MSAERPVEPALVQHVEAVRDELRAEQRALEELPRENAQLRERLERLETRRQQLLGELEALRPARPMSAPKLPAMLSPPFEAKVQQSLREPALKLLFALSLSALFILVPEGLQAWQHVAWVWGLLGVLALVALLAPPRWRFEATAAKLAGVTVHEQGKRIHHFSYRDIHDVKVLVTPSQERRGVGTLVISRSSVLDEPAILRNVPEPERLAEWLRSKRDSARDPGQ